MTGQMLQEDVEVPLDIVSSAGASEIAWQFCKELMDPNRLSRLGYPDGAGMAQRHAFFKDMDWDALKDKRVDPPIIIEEFPAFGRGRMESSPTGDGRHLGG